MDTYVEALSGERTPINHAYFTMVALDKNDKPVRVPRLELETEEEKRRMGKGRKRKRTPYDAQRRRALNCPSSLRISENEKELSIVFHVCTDICTIWSI